MKKYFAFAAIACAALVSCQKEAATVDEIPVAPVRDGYVEVSLTAGLEAGSKAVLDGNTVVWAVGDQVAVYPDASTTAETFTVTAVDFDAVKLSGSVPAGTGSFIAVYPAAQAVSRSGNVVNMHIPDVQDLPAGGTIDPSAMSSVAYFASASAKAQFKNVFSMIEFEMSNVTGVDGVVFATDFTSTEYAPGDISVEVSTSGDAPVVTNLVGGFATTVFTNEGFASGTKYYAVVPPCPEAKDFMMIAKAGGKSGHRTSEGVKTFERNKGYNVGDALKDVAFKYEFITTGEELKEFLAEASTYTQDDEVYLGGDIDLSGITLTTAESWAGQFHGQGCSLKNWTSNGVALFGANTGFIEDIALDASCSLHFPVPPVDATTDFGFIAIYNDGTVKGCVNNAAISEEWGEIGRPYYGVIIGNTNVKTGVTEDCGNTADLSFIWGGLPGSSCPYIGAIAGRLSGTNGVVTAKGCVNAGNVYFKNTGKGNNVYLGGMFGAVNNGGLIEDCVNTGDVTFDYVLGGTGAYVNLGGVLGYTAAKMTGCINGGDITYASPKDNSVTRPNIGGVAGYVAGGIEDSTNTGAISVTGMFGQTKTGTDTPSSAGSNPYPSIGGVAGIVGHMSKTVVCNNCNNSGKVTLDAGSGGTGYMRVGGVAGAINGSVDTCTNTGEIEIVSTGKQTTVGGISGYSLIHKDGELEWKDCTNSGKITYTSAPANTVFSYLGGVVGNSTKIFIMTNCTNTADIESVSASQVRVGGIGACTKIVENCTNTGNLIMRNATSSTDGDPADEITYASSMGGISAFGQGDIFGCSVNCEIINESAANTFIGGLVGAYGNTAQNYYNDDVNVRMTASSGVCVGIISGGTINNASKTVNYGMEGSPIRVSSATTINGVAVTAEDLADKDKLCGYLQKTSGFDVNTQVVAVVLN